MSGFKWIYFVSRRISRINRKGRTSVTSALASLGLCFGVASLIVVLSVMNGFQMSFKDAIMEISSYDARVSNITEQQEEEFLSWCSGRSDVECVVPFYEAQGLMAGTGGRQSAALVRAVPQNTMQEDAGFKKQLRMVAGKFDLSGGDGIIVGNTLAHNLGLYVGSRVNILALSGSSDVSLLSANRQFVVKGIFFCGYSDINAAYSFINLDAGKTNFGAGAKKTFGIKTAGSSGEMAFLGAVKNKFPDAQVSVWRDYNRSFFGALRMEKTMMFLLILLIFVVVAVNIYNGMRRLVYERKDDIAVLSALGAHPRDVQNVFVMQGASVGIGGCVLGLLLGIFLCLNIEGVFTFLSKAQYFFMYIIYSIISPQSLPYLSENPMFAVYANIPARMFPQEVAFVFLFGIFSSVLAAALAGRNILKMKVAEVLRDE